MVLILHKLNQSLKRSSKMEDHHSNSEALSVSLHDFRFKISFFISETLFLNELGSNPLSLAGLRQCFELIHVTNKALAKLATEIDYPMSEWGGKAIEVYLNFSLKTLHLLNAITSSVSHLKIAKISLVHALNQIEKSTYSAAQKFKRIPSRNLGLELKEETGLYVIQEKPFSEIESVILEALMVTKMIVFLALGLVLSGLCSDAEPYKELRRFIGESEDSLITGLHSRFSKMIELKCAAKEVEELNDTLDWISEPKSGKRWEEENKILKARLEVVENLVWDIDKQSSNLFSEVLATRNQLLDNFRLTKNNP